MTVFKTFFKIVRKHKGLILLYTVMLISFGGINLSSRDISDTFTSSKPDILIINKDEEVGVTKNLINYLENNSNIINIENDENKINDALFYRDINYVIYIDKGYREKVLNNEETIVNIKSTKDYNASLASLLLDEYLNIQNIYNKVTDNEDEIITLINDTLENKTDIKALSKEDKSSENRIARYFNFASYSILATIIFIISLVNTSFKDININKRITVSSMDYRKHNRLLLKSSLVYVIFIWLLFSILALILLGKSLLSLKGLLYILNTLIFSVNALTFGLLISSFINKNSVGGVVNVVALGSAFLCGAFIPTEFLGNSVLKLAHILPTYYFINTNNLISNTKDISSILPNILENSVMLILFIVLFIILNDIIAKLKRSN